MKAVLIMFSIFLLMNVPTTVAYSIGTSDFSDMFSSSEKPEVSYLGWFGGAVIVLFALAIAFVLGSCIRSCSTGGGPSGSGGASGGAFSACIDTCMEQGYSQQYCTDRCLP